MAKKIKRAMYQVILEITTGDTLIDGTNDEKIVSEYLNAFDDSDKAQSVKIYRLNEAGAYDLAVSKSKETERKIGFCR